MKQYCKVAKQYALDVTDGSIVSGELIKLQCHRFLDDLTRSDWRWSFNEDEGNKVCVFFEYGINHTKGPLANKLVTLEPWQCFVLCNLYGWRDGTVKRFNYVILQIARKNGKTLFASGLALYEMMFGEDGSEVYSVATKMDQARLAWDGAVQMIAKSQPEVKNEFKIVTNQISSTNKWSFYKPLGRDSKSLDGLNPSFCIYDEAAAITDRNVIDVMTSATLARDNFTHFFITTAQFSKITAYYENRLYLIEVLKGKIEDDRWFGMVYELDDESEWLDEDCWIKPNPNLGVSIDKDALRNEVKQAGNIPSKKNGVLVKHFNYWTSSAQGWIDTTEWDSDENILQTVNREGDLYVGMDLAMTDDLCAVTSLYVNGDSFHLDVKCFLPEFAYDEAKSHVKPIYAGAIERGTLLLTDGPITDYHQIEHYVRDLASNSNFKAVAYDPYNAAQLVTNLDDAGVNMLEVRQSIGHLSPAAKETAALIQTGKIKHLNDPFISWQLENCTVYTDLNENIKIRKGEDATQKIDAIIALIMAVSLASGKLDEEKYSSVSFVKF